MAIGHNQFGQSNVSGWTNIKAIAAGSYHTLGIKEDGTVVAAGGNWYGQINVSDWTNIKAIAAGMVTTIGLKEDGTVVAVGWNYYGQLNVSDWTNIKQPFCLDSVQPPASLTATDIPCDNGGSIALNWTLSPDDPAAGAGNNKVTGYNIYRADSSGGSYAAIGSVSTGVNHYIDNGAVTGTTYYYVIRATDGAKESTDTNEASTTSVRNLPLSPTGLTASDTPYDLGGSISLSWTKSTDDGTGLNNVLNYNIYRYSSTNGNIVSHASVQAGTVSYVDATTLDTDTYYYFLKAMDKNCSIESSASSIASGQSVNNLTSLPGFISALPGIAPELINSLTAKVENAIASFDRGNETAAINQLNALLSEIAAQTGNKIEAGTAEILTNYVQNLINYIKSN